MIQDRPSDGVIPAGTVPPAGIDVTAIRRVTEMVRQDATNDAQALDGQLFSAKNVATQFGNTLAMVVALCDCIDKIVGPS